MCVCVCLILHELFVSETMEEWDQEMLEKVVESKKNEYNNQNKPTEIVCPISLSMLDICM